jgi:hypothetical protein
MRFMTLIKAAESNGPPPKGLMDAIISMGIEASRAGVLVDSGGLTPTAVGGRVRIESGKLVVIDGPFAESKEVVGGFAVYDLASRAEAMEWARRFMSLHIEHWPGWEGEAEVRQIFGPNDMPS